MEQFKNKIIKYEESHSNLTYFTKVSDVPVILTAVHTMEQIKNNGKIKYAEVFTKAICMYVSEYTNCCYLIKNKDTGIDSNHSFNDTFKNILVNIINNSNIGLVIDLHGSRLERDFDIELGTLNNLSSDYSTIKELIDSFNENGIFKIDINNPFKGGKVTQKVYSETDCDVIQIEINLRYRDIEQPELLKKVCDSLISFVNQYIRIKNS